MFHDGELKPSVFVVCTPCEYFIILFAFHIPSTPSLSGYVLKNCWKNKIPDEKGADQCQVLPRTDFNAPQLPSEQGSDRQGRAISRFQEDYSEWGHAEEISQGTKLTRPIASPIPFHRSRLRDSVAARLCNGDLHAYQRRAFFCGGLYHESLPRLVWLSMPR